MSNSEWMHAKRLTAVAVVGFLAISAALAAVGYLTINRARLDTRSLAASFLQDRVAIAVGELRAMPHAGSSAEHPALLEAARAYRPTPRSAIMLFDGAGGRIGAGEDPFADAIAQRVEQTGIAGSDGSSDLSLEGELWHTATRMLDPQDPMSLRVVLAVPAAELRSANLLARGAGAAIALAVLLAVWTIASLVALGVHGAWPSPDQRAAEDRDQAKPCSAGQDPVDWVVTCVRVRSADGGGITLDTAPDEHSGLLASFESAAEEHGLRVAGRMPDRVLVVELQDDDPDQTGDRSLRFALAAQEIARSEVRRRRMLVTAGVAGGGFADDDADDDDESWGGRSLRLAEHLAATGRPETVLAGERIVRTMGSGFVFDDPGRYWIESCGQAEVWHLRGTR